MVSIEVGNDENEYKNNEKRKKKKNCINDKEKINTTTKEN